MGWIKMMCCNDLGDALICGYKCPTIGLTFLYMNIYIICNILVVSNEEQLQANTLWYTWSTLPDEH